MLAACASDPLRVTGPATAPAARGPSFSYIPAPGTVLGSSYGNGTFLASTADKSGRATSEFWDNVSSDQTATATLCNSGAYAFGNITPGCQYEALGSNANRGGYTKFFGAGATGSDAPAFTFNGSLTYTLKLEGSYTAGGSQTVGIFYKDNTGYVFVPLANFGGQVINSSYTVTPADTKGNAWGLYISNSFNPQPGGCLASPKTFCSDATGSWRGEPYQQFALFTNADATKYLVGIEDNRLTLTNQAGDDSDYNDFLISVTPSAVAAGNVGCSPGFWKNTRIANYPSPYSPSTSFQSAFGVNAFPGKTLDQVLSTGGGGLNALGRQTVGALLNAAAIPDYELSKAQVIAKFQATFAGPTSGYDTLKNEFEALTDVNGRTCPLNNGNGR